uniref:Uncharacterized protein n=1 Tax=Cucumis melo TaxID=3656 RepID=A0A9I9E415_CUCME
MTITFIAIALMLVYLILKIRSHCLNQSNFFTTQVAPSVLR